MFHESSGTATDAWGGWYPQPCDHSHDPCPHCRHYCSGCLEFYCCKCKRTWGNLTITYDTFSIPCSNTDFTTTCSAHGCTH